MSWNLSENDLNIVRTVHYRSSHQLKLKSWSNQIFCSQNAHLSGGLSYYDSISLMVGPGWVYTPPIWSNILIKLLDMGYYYIF